MRTSILGFLLFSGSVLPTLGHAQFTLSNSILHFESGKPDRQDVEIENVSDETVYLAVTPYLVREPGSSQESRDKIEDPAVGGLLVTPNKLAIQPGGRKLIRIASLASDRETEGVYRVEIAPVTNKLVAEQTGVKVLIGYEVLVLVQPKDVVTDIKPQRMNGQLSLTNAGNINVFLREGRNCPGTDFDDNQCVALADKRLYPGMTHTWALPFDGGIRYQMGVGVKYSVVEF